MNKINTCWITVNRACNLRCKWCYAFDTGFRQSDSMPLEDAKKLVDFCCEIDVKRIILIGGEPTVYASILELIHYISQKGMKPIVVTNGLVLSDKSILNKYIEAGVEAFSVSVKANGKEEYMEITGSDCFDRVLLAIRNLQELNARYSVSQVLTYDNIATFSRGIQIFKNAGAKNFSFSFCYNFNCGNVTTKGLELKNNPYVLADLFSRHFDEIDRALEDCKYSLSQGLPLCVWDYSVIEKLENKNAIHAICQLMGGGGLLFDTDLSVIPCNAMYELKYGKFGENFSDKESFETFMESLPVREFFAHLRGIPDYQCLECKKAAQCGGGCVTNWTNYSFAELSTVLKQDYENWKEEGRG